MEIFPAILEHSVDQFKSKFDTIAKFSNKLHIDIADGEFIKTKTVEFSEVCEVSDVDFGGIETEVHLMVENPLSYLQMLHREGVYRVIFHIEVVKDIDMYISNIKNYGLNWAVAINPDTSVSRLSEVLNGHNPDFIMFMTVDLGKQGQKIKSYALEKMAEFHNIYTDIKIGADGGINRDTIEKVVKNGAEHLAIGSAIFKVKNPEEEYKWLQQI